MPALAETESLGADADADANANNDPSAGLISAWEVLTCTVVVHCRGLASTHLPAKLPDTQAFGLAIY